MQTNNDFESAFQKGARLLLEYQFCNNEGVYQGAVFRFYKEAVVGKRGLIDVEERKARYFGFS